MHKTLVIPIALVTCIAAAAQVPAPPEPPKPVPVSPYVGIVYRYADTMLQRGRDTFGPEKTGLLFSPIDRATLAPPKDRPAVADALRDENLLRLLYMLSELSSKPAYRDAADAELRWLLKNAVARGATLAPWDEGLAWDVVADAPVRAGGNGDAVPPRPWMLWDRCFELDPQTSRLLVQGLRDRPPVQGGAFPRREAYAVRAFAVAYQRTKDDAMLKAIEASLARLEAASAQPEAGANAAPAAAWLSAAIDCGGAATRVPEPLAGRLRAFAAERDRAFCALPHDLKGKQGFALAPARRRGGGDDAAPNAFTPLWHAQPDGRTTAALAMMCVSRDENTAAIPYRELIRAAAQAYDSAAAPPDDASPRDFGHAISLQLAAWRSTARQTHLDRAIQLANEATKRFWPDPPLPASAPASPHYDTATGADTLALSLVELHLSILHITAVRCPPNTIDR